MFQLHSSTVCHELAHMKDQYGRGVLETADATTRAYFHDRLYFCGRYELFEGPPVHVSSTAVVVYAHDHGLMDQIFDQYADNKTGGLTLAGFVECNQALDRWTTDRNFTNRLKTRNSELWRREFKQWDKDQNGVMCKDEFIRYSAQYFGRKLKVGIKFMRKLDEYQRERNSRKQLDSSFALQLLPTVDESVFSQRISSMKPINDGDIKMTEYQYMLVMPAADRSLEDIFEKERPSNERIRGYLHEIALSLKGVHDKGLVHGDLKKLNILRVHNQLKLIDFDATTKIGDNLGVKFSSGILPPEMFYALKDNKDEEIYKAYWGEKNVNDPKRWNKLKPRNNYVVRSYRHHHNGDLPYSLVTATPAIDMWSLGCLMYQMLCGEELIPTDINQDIATDRMVMWTDEKLCHRIEGNIPDELAQELIKKLLVFDPKDRLSADNVLAHPYITGKLDFSEIACKMEEIAANSHALTSLVNDLAKVVNTTTELHTQSVEVEVQLNAASGALMQGILESSDVQCPTSFALLPFKLNQAESGNRWSQQLMEFVSLGKDVYGQLPNDKSKIMDWVEAAGSMIQPLVDKLKSGETMYLYLIDEGTGEIVAPDGLGSVYPIEIATIDDVFWKNGLPWIEKGLKLLKTGVACVEGMTKLGVYMEAHHLGPWANETKPEKDDKENGKQVHRNERHNGNENGETETGADASKSGQKNGSLRDKTNDENSANNDESKVPRKSNSNVPIVIQNIDKEIVIDGRGAELRELAQWFLKHDPNKSFGGLKRVLTDRGIVVWTSLDSASNRANVDKIQENLERIAPSNA
ncbi:Aste57867_4650 [Aphanomyces stellatus]|uniref:Aste57867_4650 protein n=1 Tax=Aphanomyces stellatus TaxID=120398 RepID=A0A485KD68_9STRA|nr:hypothetical protein As57867_004637 [Aphanomyces stellatus]VFT81753.1 Aste57867_4650 [Aphanomyces stellatus]